jgi:flagellar protein FlaG
MNLNSIATGVAGTVGQDVSDAKAYQFDVTGSGQSEPIEPIPNIKSDNKNVNQKNDDQTEEDVTEEEVNRRMESAIDQANQKVKHVGRRQCAFSYDEKAKRISIKVYDAATKEVIREIPPEETLSMVERLYDLMGIMVDEKR